MPAPHICKVGVTARLCARQRFDGQNENIGHPTRFRRAIESPSFRSAMSRSVGVMVVQPNCASAKHQDLQHVGSLASGGEHDPRRERGKMFGQVGVDLQARLAAVLRTDVGGHRSVATAVEELTIRGRTGAGSPIACERKVMVCGNDHAERGLSPVNDRRRAIQPPTRASQARLR